MSMVMLLVVAVTATVLLFAAVRVIVTRALEHDNSFRTDLTDLTGAADVVTPPGAGGPT